MTVEAYIGIGAALVGVIIAVGTLFVRLGRLTLQVDTLWLFHVERAKVEAVAVGWGKARSPIQITDLARQAVLPFLLDHFLPFYIALYAKNPKMEEKEMFYEFERKFGSFILEKICLPNGVSQGACLLAVVRSCKLAHEGGTTA